jgi:hypothetical protein
MRPRAAITALAPRGRSAWEAWRDFWFAPRPTSTLALVRIAFGLLMIGWTLSQIPTLMDFYGSEGILPRAPELSQGAWTLLSVFPGDGYVVALLVVMVLAAVCLTVGFFPRVAALVLFVGMMSLVRRDPLVHNSGDILLRIMALYLALSPCGEALSLDRLRKHRETFWEFPLRSQVGLRLMQIQVSIVYLDSVSDKLRGHLWNEGSAVSIALRLKDLERLPVPGVLESSAFLANAMTYSALAIELAAGTLIWNRRARPWVIFFGVCLHLGIDWGLAVGFFSYAVFVFYASFIDPDRAGAAVLSLRDRVTNSPNSGRKRQPV